VYVPQAEAPPFSLALVKGGEERSGEPAFFEGCDPRYDLVHGDKRKLSLSIVLWFSYPIDTEAERSFSARLSSEKNDDILTK
jgi:hypothetical protein